MPEKKDAPTSAHTVYINFNFGGRYRQSVRERRGPFSALIEAIYLILPRSYFFSPDTSSSSFYFMVGLIKKELDIHSEKILLSCPLVDIGIAFQLDFLTSLKQQHDLKFLDDNDLSGLE